MDVRHKFIDFNCDFYNKDMLENKHIVDFSSSVCIDCGFTSDTPLNISNAITFCKNKNKVIGAKIFLPEHISNPLDLSEFEIESIVIYQLGAISAFADSESMNIEYVRLSDELGKIFVENYDFAFSVAIAIKKFNKWLLLYAPACENINKISENIRLNVVKEFYLDKNYNSDYSIDFTNLEKPTLETQINMVKNLFLTSDNSNNQQSDEKFTFDSIYVGSLDVEYFKEFIEQTSNIVKPRPVNFNNAAMSGWVD